MQPNQPNLTHQPTTTHKITTNPKTNEITLTTTHTQKYTTPEAINEMQQIQNIITQNKTQHHKLQQDLENQIPQKALQNLQNHIQEQEKTLQDWKTTTKNATDQLTKQAHTKAKHLKKKHNYNRLPEGEKKTALSVQIRNQIREELNIQDINNPFMLQLRKDFDQI